MSNQVQKITAKSLFGRDDVKQKFQDMLGKKAQGFITSVLQIVASNNLLADADPNTVLQAAAVAATLDLPLNNNLGFAYIVPYKTKVKGKNGEPDKFVVVAQFQMGYKGFIQLAQRSGQFKTIAVTPIYEGQLISQNPLTGFEFDFSKPALSTARPIGYAAYFQLLNGFEKTFYMTVETVKAHGTKYSQSFKSGYGLWKDEFDVMACKTVLKLLLSKFAPMSIEMQRAVVSDQAVVNNAETEDVTYVDNSIDEEAVIDLINGAKTVNELQAAKQYLDTFPELTDLYDERQMVLVEQKKLEVKSNQSGNGQAKIEMP